MKEIFGDLFEQKADAICITTNGNVKKNGEAVMGRGCALEANRRWNCAKNLGKSIKKYGNVVNFILYVVPYEVLSFPVKHNWWEKADLKLIKESAVELVKRTRLFNWKKVVLPRPGCGAGGLDWETEVKPVLKPILDDRFYVITIAKEGI